MNYPLNWECFDQSWVNRSLKCRTSPVPNPWGALGRETHPTPPRVRGWRLWYFRPCKSNWISAWNFVSCFCLTYCMEYVWKSLLWIGIFQPTKNTIDWQYTERGQLWCQLHPRCQRLFMRGFWFRSSLKKVIPAIDRLKTRSRSIQHGKSTRSAPEVFFSRLRHSYLRPSVEDGSAWGRRISSSHATKKALVPRVCQL